MSKRVRNGQSTLEYAILIAVVVAAAIGMQIYVKRGLQGRLRQSAEQVGDQFTLIGDGGTTYASKFQTTALSTRRDTLGKEGISQSLIVDRDETTTRKSLQDEVVPAESLPQ